METRIPNVVVTSDGGYECYDTTITARDIAKGLTHGLLEIDPNRQRGKNSVTGKQVLKSEKIERWARELQDGTAIFGQLTWNFRPESANVVFEADPNNPAHGTLIINDGVGTLPDSVHRHEAIRQAVESVARGSSFDPNRRFSLRVWRVEAEVENVIFFAMNMEHDKADASRSKWLAQKNPGQKIAQLVVNRSPHLGEANVETVSNTLSTKNPRLLAFNTLSSGFEEAWADVEEGDVEAVAAWFVDFWAKLVEVLPELDKLSLAARQKARKETVTGWAIAIQGYIRLARRFRDEGHDLALLERLAQPQVVNGKAYHFFAWDNPAFQTAGIIAPTRTKSGVTKLASRNSHQTRRAMGELLAEKVGLAPKVGVKAVQAAA